MQRITYLAATIAMIFGTSTSILAQAPTSTTSTVEILVEGVKPGSGSIMVGIGDYQKASQAMRRAIVSADSTTLRCVVTNVPLGENSIWIFHDQNGNYKLDRDTNGKPVEGYGVDATGSWQPKVTVLTKTPLVKLTINYPAK